MMNDNKTKTRKIMCPHCNTNIAETGFTECVFGASTKKTVNFKNNAPIVGKTSIGHYDTKFIKCTSCNKELTTATALDIYDFMEESIDEIPGMITKTDILLSRARARCL